MKINSRKIQVKKQIASPLFNIVASHYYCIVLISHKHIMMTNIIEYKHNPYCSKQRTKGICAFSLECLYPYSSHPKVSITKSNYLVSIALKFDVQ